MRSDGELLAAWRGGDNAAGEELVARHWASVSRFCRSKLGDESADIIAQVFLACVEARDRIAGDSIKPYLFAVARKRLAEYFRQRARKTDVDFAVSSVQDLRTGPATHVARRQRSELLREGLTRIPLDDQIALELAYFEGLSMAEIASVLDIQENTVRSRLSRARDKLRDVLATLASADEVALAESQLDSRQ